MGDLYNTFTIGKIKNLLSGRASFIITAFYYYGKDQCYVFKSWPRANTFYFVLLESPIELLESWLVVIWGKNFLTYS